MWPFRKHTKIGSDELHSKIRDRIIVLSGAIIDSRSTISRLELEFNKFIKQLELLLPDTTAPSEEKTALQQLFLDGGYIPTFGELDRMHAKLSQGSITGTQGTAGGTGPTGPRAHANCHCEGCNEMRSRPPNPAWRPHHG